VSRRGRRRSVWSGAALAALGSTGLLSLGVAGRAGASIASTPLRASHRCVVDETAGFRPATITEGKDTSLRVLLHNCTATSLSLELTQYGDLVCLVADPFVRRITVAAHKTKVVETEYLAPTCAGRGHITASVSATSGKPLASRTARVVVMAPSSS